MDTLRRMRYAVTLLILLMALFVSAETAFLQNVQAVTAITLTPTSGPVDTTVQVSGSGFSTSDTSCTITSSSSNIIAAGYTCTINSGTLVASGFTVAIGSKPGTYTVTITGNTGGSGDFAQEAFTVTSPSITLNPGSQRIGGEVLVNGTGFSPQDQSCSISSPTNPGVITISGCSVKKGT
ncbi:MAG TPA: hypothetical protein VLV31_02495, partial [Candidatus Acidoferrales bacterium]|nr:hypothetical protein [Candidatus Acidoferrales bacterium]